MEPDNIPVELLAELSGKAFQTNCWRDADFRYFELTRVHRQKDQIFVMYLHEVREGNMSEDTLKFFVVTCAKPLPPSSVEPTELYARNKDVDMINKQRLEKLDAGTERRYRAQDSVKVFPGAPPWAEQKLREDKDFFLNNNLVPEEVVLRVGAQVRKRECVCACVLVCVCVCVCWSFSCE
jgi:hypothetical protein